MKIRFRLAAAIISNIFELAILVLLLVVFLPHLGINPPLWLVVISPLLWLAFSITVYHIGSVILGRRAMPGFTDMTGLKGTAATDLDPTGMISVEGELWQAVSPVRLTKGSQIRVVSQEGMLLKVEPFD